MDGGAGNDILGGGDGNDRLIGGTGNDIMAGGEGNDLYEVDNVGDSLTEQSGAGHDTVRSTITWTLGANFEDLYLLGAAAIDGTGNAADNRLEGNSGANTLSGLSGNDLLHGAAGNDTLNGGIGDDRLIGGAGNDAMSGGAGNDLYDVDGNDTVTENPSEGTDTVRSPATYTLGANLENLVLTGTATINGTGNDENNTIIGNSAANTLDGGNNQDVLLGEGGNDTLLGGNGNDELLGGLGNDSLTPGANDDVIAYRSAAEGGDTIVGFVPAQDDLAFLASGFGGGLTSGEVLVNGTTFISNNNPSPTGTDGTFLFEADTEQLFWDVDGTGPTGRVLIATFDSNTNLTASDFDIV